MTATSPLLADDARSAAPGAPGPARPPLAAGLARAVGLWGASRAVLAAVAIAVRVRAGLTPASAWWRAPLEAWTKWDTGWYLNVASGGYSARVYAEPAVVGQANYAFWPLYPLLVRATKVAWPFSWESAALLVSQLATIGAAWLLWTETARERGARDADATLVWLFLLPCAPYLSSALTEPTFLLLSLATLVAARRGRFWLAGALAALAAATRATGVLLALPLAHEYLAQRRWKLAAIRADALAVALAAAGPLAFSLRVWRLTGDPLAYVHIQHAWNRAPSTPWRVVWGALRSDQRDDHVLAACAIVVAIALWLGRRSVRRDERWYAWIQLLVPISSAITSTLRMSVALWPLAPIARDALAPRSKAVKIAVAIALAAAQIAVMRWIALEAEVAM